ncbi:Uncharacterized protein HZ326_5736 [Fusarium oxysporum f. sp. albedinis]|nr:Uncharacterized protein HZ326_5736 [Fusarium oxysporum f. sp. albedinis]
MRQLTGLAEAEIFVTDEAHGRRSRGEGGAFNRPKAGRVGDEFEQFSSPKSSRSRSRSKKEWREKFLPSTVTLTRGAVNSVRTVIEARYVLGLFKGFLDRQSHSQESGL